MGEGEFLTDAEKGKEDGEALFGCPWGYGTDGRDGVYDAKGTESVGGASRGEEVRIMGVHGEADAAKGSSEVFDDGSYIRTRLEAVVTVWLCPIAVDAVVGVAQFIVDEELKPASSWVGVWRNGEL